MNPTQAAQRIISGKKPKLQTAELERLKLPEEQQKLNTCTHWRKMKFKVYLIIGNIVLHKYRTGNNLQIVLERDQI